VNRVIEDPVALQHDIAKYADILDRGSLYGCGGCGTGLAEVFVADDWEIGDPGITCADIGVVLLFTVGVDGLIGVIVGREMDCGIPFKLGIGAEFPRRCVFESSPRR